MTMDEQTLHFPAELVERVGVNVNQIAVWKRNGCKFMGRKTCLKWVREYMDLTATEHGLAHPACPPRSNGSKSGGLRRKNG